MNVVHIIQSRITSTRFPRKVLSKIENKSILEIIFERLCKSKKINKIIFAIPNNSKNNELKKFLSKLNFNFFCGSENNVLERYYKAAINNKANIVIRISSDCALVDYKLVDKYIDLFKKKKVDYLYNGFPHTYPDGMDIEIFNFKSLKIVYQNAKTKVQKEGVTRYFRDNLKNFKTYHVSLKKTLSSSRWVLDEKKDIMGSLKNFFVSSTFWTERIGFVASLKTLEIMENEKSWEQVNQTGIYIRDGWERISKNNNLEINITGLPSLCELI